MLRLFKPTKRPHHRIPESIAIIMAFEKARDPEREKCERAHYTHQSRKPAAIFGTASDMAIYLQPFERLCATGDERRRL
jgi:hypothetical protein